ncbi:MAG TPA: lytic transglycosylase domain-containing protein [Candidatus Sulfotelmatobacter sp.]|nr:lytic transglycosylase domain-containing protein [Candidatus Sulfotelmatobacter sp.]
MAVLRNGFTIQHERREVVGELTRLYLSVDGASYVDVPTMDIDHYEEAPAPPVTSTPAAVSGPAAGFPARPKTDLTEVVNQASGRYRLDPDLVNSVIKAESGFNVRAVSPKGAQGLMQLMPGTASQLGVPNAFDAQANVDGGTKYLRELLERYNFDLVKALAAYNAGPQRVEQFGGVPPYRETRAYVARIVKDFNKKKIAQGKAAPTSTTATAKSSSPARSTTSAKSATAAKRPTPKPVTQAKATPTPSE